MIKKYHLVTLGCQMNKSDSERIAGLLNSLNYKMTEHPTQADIIILNTCSVRQASEDKTFGLIKNWQRYRQKNKNLIIAVTGCMPGRDEDGIIKRKIKGVDLWFAIDELPVLPKWLGELNFKIQKDYLSISPLQKKSAQAFVTIQTGCNNFCAYCVVPYSRGRERNRSVKDILKEVKKLAKNGCKEITLLGQVVNHYIAPDGKKFNLKNPFKTKDDFAALLWELNQIKKIERINFTASDPQYFNFAQIKALKLSNQLNYLHLPAQSGDNNILRKMNRKYTREQYIELIKKIRVAKPDIALGTDLIVGFCGETKKQFKNTLDFYKKCDFDIAYTAIYSERSGTAAVKAAKAGVLDFKDSVSQIEKKRRWHELQELMEKITFRKNQKYLNKIVEVMVEKCDKGICSGNSREMKLVQFFGQPDLINKIVKVKITQPDLWLLKGCLTKSSK
ncbi:MAG: tRNA (N6-isopentenyl adenosine(37)-C2)-methylthiotransferase MiaB [Candidatus Magasanikbacteria bacterium CG10_big_fil_rev_8_21_14_0_10_36_32]|uniref:tRNA-2-methylthio-N(6)-dimethylallyladenosine synthase n=1 Tax=Candidatus Magasanikbacteria bacterium CG10_big_fil_rev_8_21_14_0_10_36_32 TaxID=1974646 RepID=A0A2M6W6G4_9BACT|nr:MAG: tRNA (N6-isopentenyl adenosine(37)-C2)-methylthiotransferase MiaB [Candidatus Magasanikbacteria bacterium CG10_big_fil_rev_8_21_14_0_10_36_32]